ncbi:MAG: 30S ribosomal protein S7 [Chloroflexi bacterium]|nr:30S ribosomal protein S7 [Chloroflexota bacterium]MBI3762507.1 30S ribosomal protein S7 [Chloroflexota bacterium]
MPRRNRPARRMVPQDSKYHSPTVQEFVNRMMQRGKKSTAAGIMYDALTLVESRSKRQPIEVLDQALGNVAPQVEVKPRRVGGANYQVPVEVPPERRLSLAMRWLLAAARARAGKSMAEKLAGELLDAANGQGAAMKKREEVHKMAEANRAFAHYRW